MRLHRLAMLILVCGLLGTADRSLPADTAPAATATAASAPAVPSATIALSQTVEEGRKQLVATLTLAGKPVPNAAISFGVRRTFGEMPIGADTTLDDGTAAIPFPTDLPGGSTGVLNLFATVTAPPQLAGIRSDLAMPGGKVVATELPFPRALWAPGAPVALVVTIFLLVAGAWGAYAFVILQLVAIAKGARK